MSDGRADPSVELFALLADLPESERRAYLQRQYPDQPELRARLEALLEAHFRESLLDRPPSLTSIDPVAAHALADLADEDFGPYRVVEILASGGMGTVCLAQQTTPIQRPVALKMIRGDRATPEIRARFERERHALSLLNHPNIVTLLDAGETPDGAPFMVMEYINGTPITEYCRDHRLGLLERLDVFLQLCDGLASANRGGVLHRDIKPSNVLVMHDAVRPVLKIIDFGVSKIVDPRSPFRSPITTGGIAPGTPEYMSPEQAGRNAREVDVRTDVYSAGIVLWEILTDRSFRSMVEAAPGERESALLQSSSLRSVPPPLRAIVQRALAPDRGARYQSVDELAAACRAFRAKPARIDRTADVVGSRRSIAVFVGGAFALVGAAYLGYSAISPNAPDGSAIRESGSSARRADSGVSRVPQDFPTIQDAIDNAESGQTIVVAPGNYEENLRITRDVVLESVGGADRTTIDGRSRGSVVEFSGVSNRAAIRGFRITHGASSFGGGIRCTDHARPKIENNVIAENTATHGGAIAAQEGSCPWILSNKILANHATDEGGGIYLIDAPLDTVMVASNEIWGNTAGPGKGGVGGGGWFGGVNVVFIHNMVEQNLASGHGGALWVGFAGWKRIAGNSFRGNSSKIIGGAIWLDQGSSLIDENVFELNTAPTAPDMAIGDLGTHVVQSNDSRTVPR